MQTRHSRFNRSVSFNLEKVKQKSPWIVFPIFYFVLFALMAAPSTHSPSYTEQAPVILHFINSNIRVLNVQRTSPMRIALLLLSSFFFTVLANTELITRVNQIKVTWKSKRFTKKLQKWKEMWFRGHQREKKKKIVQHWERQTRVPWVRVGVRGGGVY